MDNLIAIIAIVAVFGMPVLIVWLAMHYRMRARRLKLEEEGRGEEAAELRAYAERLERRVDALEQLLDHEVPHWRKSE